MIRTFNTSKTRKKTLLNGIWKFKTDAKAVGIKEKWYNDFPSDCGKTIVPSCWNNEADLYHYEGVCWYKTSFENSKSNINLLFHGVTGQANVYVDGDCVGSHYGGFTGFSVEINNLKIGMHNLVVLVDNTHDDMNTIPLSVVDWFHYGGITRDVELVELNNVWIKDCKINYELSDELTTARVRFDLALSSCKDGIYEKNLKIYCGTELLYEDKLSGRGETRFHLSEIEMKGIKLWDTDDPQLYYFSFIIDGDDLTERIGFRKISIESRKIMLNNRQIHIKGINRHEDHPDWGFAMPLNLMKKDIDIIKKMGCNAIRGSHYPNAPVFLDMCDEEGLLFWEEIPMWGFPEEPLKNPVILKRGLTMHTEMVMRDYHHPCIIIWGMHNEIATDMKAGFDLTEAFAKHLKSMDNSRLITYATNRPLDDICFSLADIISANVYIGWYNFEWHDKGENAWPSFFEKFEKKLKNEGVADKPIIMSEFGAGGIYGDKCLEERKWSETYQAQYLDEVLTTFEKTPCVSGTYIWQYCDIRTPKENELGRPRSFNNKGILNEYRQPKLAYWVVKKKYS